MNLLQELIRFQKRVLDMLKDCKKRITILVSTPYMDEAALCDRLIQKGAILKIDTPTNIISNYDKPIYNVRTRNTHQLIQDLKEYLANTVYMPFIISIKCRFQSRWSKDLSRKQKSFWNNHQKR
jgi:ABC-type multidrug transport system ATPase subunit